MAVITYLLQAAALQTVECIAFDCSLPSHTGTVPIEEEWLPTKPDLDFFSFYRSKRKMLKSVSCQQTVQILFLSSLTCEIPVCTCNIWLVMHKLSSADHELKGCTISSILISLLHLVNALGKQIIQSTKIPTFKSLERSLVLPVLFWAQGLSLGTLIKLFYSCAVLELLMV